MVRVVSSGEMAVAIVLGVLTFGSGVAGAVFGYRGHVRAAEAQVRAAEIEAQAAKIACDVEATRHAIGTPNGKGDLLQQMARLWDLNEKIDTHHERVMGRLDLTDKRVGRLSAAVSQHLREHAAS